MAYKQFEIFCGTGGVGKTTLASSRAISLAQTQKKVLLITIDPAKRLKDYMSLNDNDAGENIKINDPLHIGENIDLTVHLMSPKATIKRMAQIANNQDMANNRIIDVLSRPYGGLNEILALVELNINLKKNIYDVIILDTPPGPHFLDFLESAQKIKIFFDQNFIDIFNFLTQKEVPKNSFIGKKIIAQMASSGMNKLLSYLETVTGKTFIDEFLISVSTIYKSKDSFLSALNLLNLLKDSKKCHWFLVTSADQSKAHEAIALHQSAKHILNYKETSASVIVNKCQEKYLQNWDIKNNHEVALKLKNSLLEKEKSVKYDLKTYFKDVIEFDEIIGNDISIHLKELTNIWKNISIQ